jgi:hypothetical protein
MRALLPARICPFSAGEHKRLFAVPDPADRDPSTETPRPRYWCSQCRQQRLVDTTTRVDRDRRISRWRCLNCWHTIAEAHVDPPPPDPKKPSTAPPGSAARIEEYRKRVLRGEAVFHPDDAPIQPEDVTAGIGQHGVRRKPGRTGWEAWFEMNARKVHVGTFSTLDQAIRARALARLAAGIVE